MSLPRWWPVALAASAIAGLTGPAIASPVAIALESGLRLHGLRERAADGGVLVRESAIVPVLALRMATTSDGDDRRWASWAALQAWGGDARYDGRSQAGTPVDSRTGTVAARLELGVERPVGAALRLQAGLHAERLARRIRSAGIHTGLDERTTQLQAFAGLRWTGPGAEAWLQAARGPGGPLSVRFDGGLADDARLHTGATVGWSLGASRSWKRDWRLSAEVGRQTIRASDAALLTAAGRPIGTVTQPRWEIDRLQLGIGRSFH